MENKQMTWYEKILENLFPGDFYGKEISAAGAYTVAKYGALMTQENIIRAEVRSISDNIKGKVREGKYSLAWDITSKNEMFVKEIKDYFQDRGFQVNVVDSNVISDFPDYGILLITWKHQSYIPERKNTKK